MSQILELMWWLALVVLAIGGLFVASIWPALLIGCAFPACRGRHDEEAHKEKETA